MADTYKNFSELAKNMHEDLDYKVTCIDLNSDVTCLCIHGYNIEPGTSELADALSHNRYNLYKFEGIRGGNNKDLHLTSSHFDDPRALKLVQKAKKVISLHGAKGPAVVTYIGGLDEDLKNKVKKILTANGFNVENAPTGLDGKSPLNIANRGATNSGCQLEITRGQREQFFEPNNLMTLSRIKKSELFYLYIDCLRKALDDEI